MEVTRPRYVHSFQSFSVLVEREYGEGQLTPKVNEKPIWKATIVEVS